MPISTNTLGGVIVEDCQTLLISVVRTLNPSRKLPLSPSQLLCRFFEQGRMFSYRDDNIQERRERLDLFTSNPNYYHTMIKPRKGQKSFPPSSRPPVQPRNTNTNKPQEHPSDMEYSCVLSKELSQKIRMLGLEKGQTVCHYASKILEEHVRQARGEQETS